MKTPSVALVVACLAVCAAAQFPAADGTSARVRGEHQAVFDVAASLDGAWTLVTDPGALGLRDGWAAPLSRGEPPFDGAVVHDVVVPGALEQVEELITYDGVVWQTRTFTAPDAWPAGRLRLHFERVNHACRVWLDGAWLGDHVGGYAPFAFDVSDRCTPGAEHVLVVMVLDPGATETFGMTLKTTPHAKESWYHNWGGIVGSVTLRVVPEYVLDAPCAVHRPIGRVEVSAPLRRADGGALGHVDVEVVVTRGGEEVARATGPADGSVIWSGQSSGAAIKSNGDTVLAPWSPEDPNLYDVELRVGDAPIARVTTGVREVRLDADGFSLNGVRRVPKAVLYQPHHTGLGGVPPSAEALEREVAEILGAGFDMARVHVAPAEPAFLDAADRLGLMVLEEPAIGWVDDAPALRERLLREVRWTVERDRHRASIVIWGVLNELSGAAYRHAPELMDAIAALDTSRPILEDSGGFFRGGRYWPAFADAPPSALRRPMVDAHEYPPFPLPSEDRVRLSSHAHDDGPVFVSEFGYGAMLDAKRAYAGFVERELMSEERVVFGGARGAARRARRAGAGWTTDSERGWLDAAQALHADAAEEFVAALRANPELDLLCFTQWRAVSKEASAGVVAPWGERRPVYERLREALAPVAVIVEPARESVRAGREFDVTVRVVNETRAELAVRAARLEVGDVVVPLATTWPSGHGTQRVLASAPDDGSTTVRVVAVLETDAGELRGERVLPVVPDGPLTRLDGTSVEPAELRVWIPDDDVDAQEFVSRTGFTRALPGEGAEVALLAAPEELAERLSFAERLRLFHFVRTGGVAVLLPSNPNDAPLGRLLGAKRGVSTLAAFPVELILAPAPGNFMGRLHVARRAGGRFVPEGAEVDVDVAPLGRGDGLVSPRAMLTDTRVDGLRRAIVTLGYLGDERGSPLVDVPYGDGVFRVVGLPLLEPVGSVTDAHRDRVLAELLVLDPPRPRAHTPPPALPPPVVDGLALASDLVEQAVAFGDRLSPMQSAGGRPTLGAEFRAALAARDDALTAALDGRIDDVLPRLGEVVASVASDEARAYVAVEARVLAALERLAATSTDTSVPLDRARADWDLAARLLEHWTRATFHWTHGDRATALDWIGRADLLVSDGASR